jgi:hypothetical protein
VLVWRSNEGEIIENKENRAKKFDSAYLDGSTVTQIVNISGSMVGFMSEEIRDCHAASRHDNGSGKKRK